MAEIDRLWARRLIPTFGVAWMLCVAAVMLIHARRLAIATFGPGLGVQDFLHILACASVTFAVLAAPPAALASVVWVAGRWREDSELTAWTGVGVGPWRLARVPMALSVAASLAAMPLAWTLEPWAHQALARRLAQVAARNAWARVEPGSIHRIAGGSATVEARQGSEFLGLKWADDGGRSVLIARRVRTGDDGTALELIDGRMRQAGREVRFARAEIPFAGEGPKLRLGGDLSRPAPAELLSRARRATGSKRHRLLREAHRRMAEPAAVAALALWGLAAALGRPWRPRRRVIWLSAAGIVLHYGLARLADAAVGLHPAVAGWLPTLAVGLLSVGLLHRGRRPG